MLEHCVRVGRIDARAKSPRKTEAIFDNLEKRLRELRESFECPAKAA
jgi:hypothetical protein